jgi:hypothetical protein
MRSLKDDDGWYECPDVPQQHDFWQSVSLCRDFESIPPNAHHDNVPLRHCERCEQKVNRLMAVASSLPQRKLTMKELMNLMEQLGRIDWNKGSKVKVETPEHVCALIGHADNTTTFLEKGVKSSKARPDLK